MYNFYEDPGHGWLKVPIKELTKLNIADKKRNSKNYKQSLIYKENKINEIVNKFTNENKSMDTIYILKI